jgi:hypothetical protein
MTAEGTVGALTCLLGNEIAILGHFKTLAQWRTPGSAQRIKFGPLVYFLIKIGFCVTKMSLLPQSVVKSASLVKRQKNHEKAFLLKKATSKMVWTTFFFRIQHAFLMCVETTFEMVKI